MKSDEERIQTLESTLWSWRSISVCAAAALLGVVALAAAPRNEAVPNVLEAREFRAVDAQGKPWAILKSIDGSGYVWLGNKFNDSEARIFSSVDGTDFTLKNPKKIATVGIASGDGLALGGAVYLQGC